MLEAGFSLRIHCCTLRPDCGPCQSWILHTIHSHHGGFWDLAISRAEASVAHRTYKLNRVGDLRGEQIAHVVQVVVLLQGGHSKTWRFVQSRRIQIQNLFEQLLIPAESYHGHGNVGENSSAWVRRSFQASGCKGPQRPRKERAPTF